jgi:intracellular multiplication protein IcmP
LAFVFIGRRVLSKNPFQKFRRSHSMKTLVQSEQRLWPAISPVAKLELIPQDIDKGPWAMSRKPLDFARSYKLLDEGNKLNRDRSEKLFAMQLGKLWEGSGKLPAYARALFACFASQACGDIESAKLGLDKLSLAMADGREDYSWVPELLAKYEKSEKVQSVVKRHAYVYTVMASMLKAAREFGVMQSPQFIWLRPKNRQLWYILNGVGRRVAFAEIAGIYAHWIAEEVAEHPIERPYVVKAVDGLERALLEVKID